MPSIPLLSIGLPVFNGENFLEETLNSILAQTFKDFEIIISDNASTDRTAEIGKAYSAQDKRVLYHRNKNNVGIARNFNRTFELSRGQYFQWTSHDDLYDRHYFEKCIRILEDDPSVILCHAQAKIIDHHGEILFGEEYRLRTNSSSSCQRFGDLICASHHQHRGLEQFGIIRSSALKQTSLMGLYAHADRLLLAQLSLLGKFYQVPEDLFFYRDHSSQSVKTSPQSFAHSKKRLLKFSGPLPPTELWDPSKKGKIDFPEWRVFYKYADIIQHSSLSGTAKMQCYSQLILRLFMHKNWARLLRDLIMAFEQQAGVLTSKS